MIAKRKKSRLAGDLGIFIQQYRRKAQKGGEPNDRRYDRKIEAKMKRLDPTVLSNFLSGDEDTIDPDQGKY